VVNTAILSGQTFNVKEAERARIVLAGNLCPLRVDIVEKGLCCEHGHFLKTSDAFDAAGRGGPHQHSQDCSVIFLALLRRVFLPDLALS
jgi:hypothetical protein